VLNIFDFLAESFLHSKSFLIAFVLNRLGFKTVSAKSQIRDMVLKKYAVLDSSVCHILGSGWSLNESKALISDDDFVIGFNQSALAGTKLDLYFVEFGGWSVCVESEQQIRLVKDYIIGKTDLVFFKNTWESKNNVSYIVRHWPKEVFFLRDMTILCRKESDLHRSILRLLNHEGETVRQLLSSVLTSVSLATYFGFKNIVIHGVDFGGKYFFDADDFDGIRGFDFSTMERKYFRSDRQLVHSTAKGECSMKDILPLLGTLLARRGVELSVGSLNSPSAAFLPVYDAKSRGSV